jgi:retinol-binding protein 3
MIRIASVLVLSACLFFPVTARAQGMFRDDQPDLAIDAKSTSKLIDGVVKHLSEAYVFPATAKTMEADLRKRQGNHEYEAIKSARKLAEMLTEHLQAISKDKHLRVFYSYDPIPEPAKDDGPKPGPGHQDEMEEAMREFGRSSNFGFEKVERLEGNVGYLELRMFMSPSIGGETAAAAMNLLAHTDALIIDLRKNGGGEPGMVALISSYLFGAEPVHLNDLYFRPGDSTQQFWTLPHVPGSRCERKPVYVLTSSRTFSAAEEFAYNLKNLKRATIVGETTGGGAHPGEVRRITEHFNMFVPSGRAINPITKTNWEGTGVTPDVPVAADRALPSAHLAALKTVVADMESRPKGTRKPADGARIDRIKKLISRLEKELAAPGKAAPTESVKPAA